jgi:hypothetical protein
VLVGRQLQKQRQLESWDAVSVFLKDQADPAENDPDLESKLQNNYKDYFPRIQNVSIVTSCILLSCVLFIECTNHYSIIVYYVLKVFNCEWVYIINFYVWYKIYAY